MAETSSPAAPRWTAEQEAAIRTTGVNLLVSAAAGSGKTAVLSERCAYLVCDAPDPCDIDELLVVTYTEAAAAEMKSRIQGALRRRLESRPDDARLGLQVALAERAQVSTIHGFCARLLRQHFQVLGLDPGFAVLDPDEAALLRARVARELFDDHYEQGEDFSRFVDDYGDGKDDGLIQTVLHAHHLMGSLIDPDAWSAAARARIHEALDKPLRAAALGKELGCLIVARLEDLNRDAEAARLVSQHLNLPKYVDHVVKLQGAINEWRLALGAGDLDALARELAAFEAPRLPSVSTATPGRDRAKALIDALKEQMSPSKGRGKAGTLQNLASQSEQSLKDGLRAIAPAADVFLELVAEFAARYTEAKREARGMDFADLEVLALRVLREPPAPGQRPDKIIASKVARICRRQFKHVLVDEYQDINEVQDAILGLVSREGAVGGRGAQAPNLFCVGDVKQSIYGFRLAEPFRFQQRAVAYRQPRQTLGQVIDLRQNFRGRAPLLESINAVFERLMTQAAADIEYDQSHRLAAGLVYPPHSGDTCFTGSPVELLILSKDPRSGGSDDAEEAVDTGDADASADLNRIERETSLIAQRIHQMMGHVDDQRKLVARKEGGGLAMSPLRYRDIVVLLRSMQFKGDDVAQVLERHGIPTHRQSGAGYFGSVEVRDMLALLHLLDNARQDIPLASFLRGPLANLPAPADALARIRLAYIDSEPPVAFHVAAERYAIERDDELAARLRDILEDLRRWRELSRLRPLAELIWTIYDETGFLAHCNGLHNGEQRVANLLHLHERARQFGTFARQGLYRFLQFLQKLQDESDPGQPSVLSEADNVVRVMTIHQSKGLEFPVVFLPDLGKRINMQSASGSILVDRHAGLGLSVADEERGVRYPSLASVLVRERLRRAALAEELRVLYVAMTRAREHLVLIGSDTQNNIDAWSSRYADHPAPLDANVVLDSTTMLDWLGPAAASMAGKDQPPVCMRCITWDEMVELTLPNGARERTPRQIDLANLTPLSPAPAPDAAGQAVIDRLTRPYAHAAFTRLAAFQSVTRLTKQGAPLPITTIDGDESGANATAGGLQSPAEKLLEMPAFFSQQTRLAAVDIGTATHLVLEHLDFTRPCAKQDLEAQIDGLIGRKLMLPAHAQAVDRAAVEWFIGSDIGQLARRHAGALWRELPFNLSLIPAADDPRFEELQSDDPADRAMVRGRIDLVIPSDNGLLVVDYKTDRVDAATLDARAQFYRRQVELYKIALTRLTSAPFAGVCLSFLHARQNRMIQ